MPELPEVESIRLVLEPLLTDLSIRNVIVKNSNAIQKNKNKNFTQKPCVFIERLENAKFINLQRKGKNLFLILQKENQKYYLLTHFMMTGALFYTESIHNLSKTRKKHCHIIFELSNNHLLLFSEIRLFGGMQVFSEKEFLQWEKQTEIAKDPFSFKNDELLHTFRTHPNVEIKNLMLKQPVISGIGNIYACESLFHARIHPTCRLKELSDEQILFWFTQLQRILKESIQLNGSSISDYVLPNGSEGRYQTKHQVYKKAFCSFCKAPIQSQKFSDGRTSYFCPVCQKK